MVATSPPEPPHARRKPATVVISLHERTVGSGRVQSHFLSLHFFAFSILRGKKGWFSSAIKYEIASPSFGGREEKKNSLRGRENYAGQKKGSYKARLFYTPLRKLPEVFLSFGNLCRTKGREGVIISSSPPHKNVRVGGGGKNCPSFEKQEIPFAIRHPSARGGELPCKRSGTFCCVAKWGNDSS